MQTCLTVPRRVRGEGGLQGVAAGAEPLMLDDVPDADGRLGLAPTGEPTFVLVQGAAPVIGVSPVEPKSASLEIGLQAIQLSPYRADPPTRRSSRLDTAAGLLACSHPVHLSDPGKPSDPGISLRSLPAAPGCDEARRGAHLLLVVQRKVVSPNDFFDLADVEAARTSSSDDRRRQPPTTYEHDHLGHRWPSPAGADRRRHDPAEPVAPVPGNSNDAGSSFGSTV